MTVVGMDLEWTRDRVIDVLGLAWDNGHAATATARTPESLSAFLDVLDRADVVVGQNILDADFRQLAHEHVDTSALRAKAYDIRLAMHAVNGHLAGTGSYDLRSIVLLTGARQGERFSLDWKRYESDLHATCAYDAAAALWVYPTLDRQVKSANLSDTLAIAHRCAHVFALMHEQGLRLDRAVLGQLYTERKRKLAENIDRFGLWEERGKKVIKRVPIWRSPKLLDLFESKFHVRPANLQRGTWVKLVSSGRLSGEAREFAEAVIELGRGANDAHWLGQASESADGIEFEKVGDDGMVYPRYDLCGSPDRAIASSPNCQNFPRVSDDPRAVPLRRAVVPLHPGQVLLGVDFSSVETITNAFESQDMDRVRAVLAKQVSHEGTAQMVNTAFGFNLTRQDGKAVNHAFDKGESPYNLARRLFQSERPSRQHVRQCEQIYEQMLRLFPQTAKFRDQLWEQAQNNPLVVTNAFGRRLLCFSRSKYGDSGDRWAKHIPERKYWCSCAACTPRRDRWKYAIAFLGRSCAFDALLRKMATIHEEQRLGGYSLPYIEVHDELDFSVPVEAAQKYSEAAVACFQEPIPELGGISLPAEAKIGKDWSEAH